MNKRKLLLLIPLLIAAFYWYWLATHGWEFINPWP